MSTTVNVTIIEQRTGLLSQPSTQTELSVTRPTKAGAVAAALTMIASAHKDEIVAAWDELRAQVEPLLDTAACKALADIAAAAPAEGTAEAGPR